jgi:hypothetical protein
MEYRVIPVHRVEGSGCCDSPPKSLFQEIQDACNEMANQGFVLIAIYPENFEKKVCGQFTIYRGAVLVFGRKN